MPDLSAQQLLDLAAEKLGGAKLLQNNDRFGNAYHLAGYAIELSLKAAIPSRFQANTIPDKELAGPAAGPRGSNAMTSSRDPNG